MHDGWTKKVDSLAPEQREPFLSLHSASLTILRGPAAGTEFTLERKRAILGRGADVEFQIDDASISSEHVAFELDDTGFGIRDLASTNGVMVNGAEVLASALKHGDRISLGKCELQYVVEDRARETKSWNVEGVEDDA